MNTKDQITLRKGVLNSITKASNLPLDTNEYVFFSLLDRVPTPPNNKSHKVHWEEFNHRNKSYLHLSAHGSKMRHHLRAEKVAFWNVLIPRLKTESRYRVVGDPYKNDYVTKMWAFLGISAILLLGIVILLVLLIRAKMREVQKTHWDSPERRNGHGPTIV